MGVLGHEMGLDLFRLMSLLSLYGFSFIKRVIFSVKKKFVSFGLFKLYE